MSDLASSMMLSACQAGESCEECEGAPVREPLEEPPGEPPQETLSCCGRAREPLGRVVTDTADRALYAHTRLDLYARTRRYADTGVCGYHSMCILDKRWYPRWYPRSRLYPCASGL